MNIAGFIITYVLCWWMIFFMMLPHRGKHVADNPDAHTKGSDRGAPINPNLKGKALTTSWVALIAAVLVAGTIILVNYLEIFD